MIRYSATLRSSGIARLEKRVSYLATLRFILALSAKRYGVNMTTIIKQPDNYVSTPAACGVIKDGDSDIKTFGDSGRCRSHILTPSIVSTLNSEYQRQITQIERVDSMHSMRLYIAAKDDDYSTRNSKCIPCVIL